MDFWEHYEVETENVAINPQEQMVRFVSDIRDFLQLGRTALSLGCGFGTRRCFLVSCARISRLSGSTSWMTREPTPKIRCMKVISDQVRVDRVEPLLADGGRLPFRGATFDCVIAIDSPSHADCMREDRT